MLPEKDGQGRWLDLYAERFHQSVQIRSSRQTLDRILKLDVLPAKCLPAPEAYQRARVLELVGARCHKFAIESAIRLLEYHGVNDNFERPISCDSTRQQRWRVRND